LTKSLNKGSEGAEAVLQISRRADYAVRIMLELGLHDSNKPLSAAELAEIAEVSKAFLHKIVADLVKAGLVVTYKGPAGGIVLARPTAAISMLDVLAAVDGPVCLNACLLRPNECPRDALCPAHLFWGRLQSMVMGELKKATLDKLVMQARTLKAGREYPINIPYVLER
jgi:Rrf2 family iron-sulfur cluster assembly transcriptional regulator